MTALLGIIKGIFGIGVGESVVNKIGGIANNLAMIPLVIWLANNADEKISFETSYGFLALVGAVAYLILEVLRRSRTSGQV
jgi:hypothetical protein